MPRFTSCRLGAAPLEREKHQEKITDSSHVGFRLPSRIPTDTRYSRTSFKFRPPKQKATATHVGGIRGIVPAMVLAEIERKTGKPVSKLFGLINGTSTGVILTLELAEPATGGQEPRYKAQELADLYEKEGERPSPARSSTVPALWATPRWAPYRREPPVLYSVCPARSMSG